MTRQKRKEGIFIRVIKYLVKRISTLLVIGIVLSATTFLGVPSEVFTRLFSSIFIVIVTFDLIILISVFDKHLDRKAFRKSLRDPDEKLYRWAGQGMIADEFLYDLFSKSAPQKAMENLIVIKEKLKKASSGDLSNLHLLKSYIDLKTTNSVTDRFWTVFIAIIIGAITSIVTKTATGDKFISKVFSIIQRDNNLTAPTLVSIIDYCTIAIIFFIILLFFWQQLTSERNRLKLISITVDACIKEIESKEKKE